MKGVKMKFVAKSLISAVCGAFMGSFAMWFSLVTIRKGDMAACISAAISVLIGMLIMCRKGTEKLAVLGIFLVSQDIMRRVYKALGFMTMCNRMTSPNPPLDYLCVTDYRTVGTELLSVFAAGIVLLSVHLLFHTYESSFKREIRLSALTERLLLIVGILIAAALLISTILMFSQIHNEHLVNHLIKMSHK
ncbi:MAG: hypothetical protein IJ071_09050 [Ruminococcus sp.]|nr:hypothetical protein [Ruminococcus sp.]